MEINIWITFVLPISTASLSVRREYLDKCIVLLLMNIFLTRQPSQWNKVSRSIFLNGVILPRVRWYKNGLLLRYLGWSCFSLSAFIEFKIVYPDFCHIFSAMLPLSQSCSMTKVSLLYHYFHAIFQETLHVLDPPVHTFTT